MKKPACWSPALLSLRTNQPERPYSEIRNQTKMANVVRCHSVIKFNRRHADQKVGKRGADSVGPALAVDPSRAQRCGSRQ